MNTIKAYLKLIRLPNLLIVALTLYLMRWMIIHPILKNSYILLNNRVIALDAELQFSDLHFFMLVIATVLLTAAGYVINDYFDRKPDLVNKPDQVVIGRKIHRRTAITLHWILNGIGVALGTYISYKSGMLRFSIIYFLIVGLLWYYSTTYKRQFLIGNLLVALMTALVPLMVLVYEYPLLSKEYMLYMRENGLVFNSILFWVLGFSGFAFLTTLSREIIKDMEDFEGDQAYGGNTLPIVLGIRSTKIVVISLTLLLIAALVFCYVFYLRDNISLIYLGVFLVLPHLYLIYVIARADSQEDYHRASNISKLLMLFGVLYALVVGYNFSHENLFHYQLMLTNFF